MSIFILIVGSKKDEVKARLAEAYPGSLERLEYPDADNVFLVNSDDLASIVAEKAGINGEKRIEGVSATVFNLTGNYAGFAKPAIWEWLSKTTEAQQ